MCESIYYILPTILIMLQIIGDKHPVTKKRLHKLRQDRYVQIVKQRGEKWWCLYYIWVLEKIIMYR